MKNSWTKNIEDKSIISIVQNMDKEVLIMNKIIYNAIKYGGNDFWDNEELIKSINRWLFFKGLDNKYKAANSRYYCFIIPKECDIIDDKNDDDWEECFENVKVDFDREWELNF